MFELFTLNLNKLLARQPYGYNKYLLRNIEDGNGCIFLLCVPSFKYYLLISPQHPSMLEKSKILMFC